MGSPFKMTPKQEGFIKAMRKAGKTEAANKIEAGIKKNDKESVDGAMLMNKDYALKMGGYEGKSSTQSGTTVSNWFKQKRKVREEAQAKLQAKKAKKAVTKLDDNNNKDPRYKYNEEGKQVAIKDRTSGGAYELSTAGKKAATERTGTFDPEAGRNKPFAGTYIDTEGNPTTDSSKAKGFKDEKGKYQQFSTSRSEKAKQIATFDRKKRLHEADRARMEELRKTQAEYKGTTKQAGKSPAKMYGKKK
jgi:hypothetical protein